LLNYGIFETDTFVRGFYKTLQYKASSFREILFSKVYPQLKNQPYYGPNIKKLKSYVDETWRYRIGDYRLFYRINPHNKLVSILTIEHRKDAY